MYTVLSDWGYYTNSCFILYYAFINYGICSVYTVRIDIFRLRGLFFNRLGSVSLFNTHKIHGAANFETPLPFGLRFLFLLFIFGECSAPVINSPNLSRPFP